MDEYEYVVVSLYSGTGTTKVSGPYSKRQARRVANNTIGDPEVVRIVRPTYWLLEDDDLSRYRPVQIGTNREAE